MILSDDARARATKVLSEVLEHPVIFSEDHTLPIRQERWEGYSNLFAESLRLLGAALDSTPDDTEDFQNIRVWSERTADAYARAMATLSSLSPFSPFEHSLTVDLEIILHGAMSASRDAAGRSPGPEAVAGKLEAFCDVWTETTSLGGSSAPLEVAFGLTKEPLDFNGDFKAAAVFSAYRYDNGRLMIQLIPHLRSLGVPPIPDLLACVSMVGWIVQAEDPVIAYVAFREMRVALIAADNQMVRDDVLAHFRDQEGAIRQTRMRIHAARARVDADDLESVALSAADIYKRVVESSVRQYGWTLACLAHGKWSPPETLTPVRERMIALGGLARGIAEQCALTNLRNGEAHENLEWDGIAECFRVGAHSIGLAEVGRAITLGLSFEQGCASAVAFLRAVYLKDEPKTPSSSERYRMPAWHRAESYFGTNGLLLLKADFNRPQAVVQLEAFDGGDVNPCFQALVVVRQLIPGPLSYEVRVEGQTEPVIVVDAKALDETYPVWESSRDTFMTTPFSAFLPANLAARRLIEPDSTALRSVCWIAADDVLDAFDSARHAHRYWPSEVVELVDKRLRLAMLALDQCCNLPGVEPNSRIAALRQAFSSLAVELAAVRRETGIVDPDLFDSVERIRQFWSAWGPVPRFPGVTAESTRVDTWPSRLRTESDGQRIGSI